jgi:hypothetical protein
VCLAREQSGGHRVGVVDLGTPVIVASLGAVKVKPSRW